MTKHQKRSRTVRGKHRGLVLTLRDRDVLILIGSCRYASAAQVARACFPNEDRARRRLRQLFDAGLISTILYSSTAPNIVALTKRGLEELTVLAPAVASRIRLPGPLRLASLPHHLAIVDARLYAAGLGVLRGALLARFESGSGSLAAELALPTWHVTPDALAEFKTPEGLIVIAVEVDRGTETLKTIKGKLDRYQGLADEDTIDALWLVVTSGPARQEHLATLIDEAGLSSWARVLDHAFITARPVKELPNRGGGEGGAGGPNTVVPSAPIREGSLGVVTPNPASEGLPDRPSDRRGLKSLKDKAV